jgi:tetratricopeptide (TPR) repeat protein
LATAKNKTAIFHFKSDKEKKRGSLIEKENELRKLAESGEDNDILRLADCLYHQKKYIEAKEKYLKIAGPEDFGGGDANSHLFQMLLDMGEYEEALKYYGYIQDGCDTGPAEGAYNRMDDELRNPESKLFMYLDDDLFYDW